MIRTIHRAKYVMAEADVVLQDGAVHVCDPGRICRVEPWQGPPTGLDCEVKDWGAAVILPGLVNAHTHLELTRMKGLVPTAGSFTDWLAAVVRTRRAWTREDHLASTREGARMSLASGTTLVGDISAGGMSAQALVESGLRKVVFEEVLGLAPEAVPKSIAGLESRLWSASDPLLVSGISPHAPYSVSPELYRSAAQVARARDLPMATHLAETKAELQFLSEGKGDLHEFLGRLGALPAGWSPPRLAPVPYLDSLGVLDRSPLLIHCNYLEPDSVSRILARRSSVAFCPRSHAWFGHRDHPVRKLLDAGINVALGTDSLASNESLSVLDEMRFLRKARGDLRCEEILRMATLNGAAALGFGGVLGRLRRGFWADMTILRIPEQTGARNLAAQILEGAGDCLATVVCGRTAWQGPL